MPLINKLLMYCDKLQAVISICDCTGHMIDGGKKDAKYIMDFFKAKADEIDPSKVYTGSFFFDGAEKVQKSGQILCVHFHKQCVFMGGLGPVTIFSDLSRLGAIKARNCLFFFLMI